MGDLVEVSRKTLQCKGTKGKMILACSRSRREAMCNGVNLRESEVGGNDTWEVGMSYIIWTRCREAKGIGICVLPNPSLFNDAHRLEPALCFILVMKSLQQFIIYFFSPVVFSQWKYVFFPWALYPTLFYSCSLLCAGLSASPYFQLPALILPSYESSSITIMCSPFGKDWQSIRALVQAEF